MPKNLSTTFKTNLNLVSGGDYHIVLLEIDHPTLSEPIRLVNDIEAIHSNGFDYVPCPYNINLINDAESERPKVTLSISNIGKELTNLIEKTQGARVAKVSLKLIQKSLQNNIEYEIELDFLNIAVTPFEVTGELSLESILDKKAIGEVYSPLRFAGLFNSTLDV